MTIQETEMGHKGVVFLDEQSFCPFMRIHEGRCFLSLEEHALKELITIGWFGQKNVKRCK